MKFRLKCPDCNAVSSTLDDPSGHIVKCPKCGGAFHVPVPKEVPERLVFDREVVETVTKHIEGKPIEVQIRILAEYLDHTEEVFLEMSGIIESMQDQMQRLLDRMS